MVLILNGISQPNCPTFPYFVRAQATSNKDQDEIKTSRQTTFKVMRQNKKKVCLIALANRSFIVNDKIPLDWLNNSFETFKVKCKLKFLM